MSEDRNDGDRARARRDAPAHDDDKGLLLGIGERVRTERAKRGMTRRALAEQCRTSARYLGQIESGTGNPSVLVLGALARAFDLDAAELMPGGDGLRKLRSLPLETLVSLMRTAPPAFTDRARRVALVGLRGAGKTTLGTALAAALGCPFHEVNAIIEARHGAPMATLFEVYGQSAFRRYERECLHQLYFSKAGVIAPAGGIVAAEDTFNGLLERAHVIWLQATPADHMRRVMAQGDFRPMQDQRDAMEDLVAILEARAPSYARAHATIKTSGRSVEDCVKELVEIVRELFERN